MRFSIFIILFIVFYTTSCSALLPTAKITAKVVDTEGKPVEGVDTFARFLTGTDATIVEGKTDKEGFFTATGKTIGECNINARKEGYYGAGVGFREVLKDYSKITRQWQPWNPTGIIVLKDIRNPTQMYAKYTGYLDIPILGKPVGYDLEIGSWVTPYGKGNNKDFIFIFKKSDKDAKPGSGNWSISYKLFFTNEKDGIQEYYPDKQNSHSRYPWPYEAPKAGYQNSIEGFSSIKDGYVKKSFDKKRNYIFRVRTELDDQGNIVEAKYGKIREDFQIGLSRTSLGVIHYTYYYNPTGNRNLEYDIKKTLFTFPRNESGMMGAEVSRP
ncbi:MAG: Ig-like domain-containing protein [Desulfobacter sp.]